MNPELAALLKQYPDLFPLLSRSLNQGPQQPMGPQPRPQLTTGPIQWDEKALEQARQQQPIAQMRQMAPWLIPGGMGLGALAGGLRGGINLLRDPRLEMMFMRGLRR